MRPKPRILLIDDEAGRISLKIFERWARNTEFVLVVTRSGGLALDMHGNRSTEAVAGLQLDHDLSDSPLTPTDMILSATDLIPLIKKQIRPSVPVLIHLHDASKPVVMQRALKSDGFTATRVRLASLAEESFRASLDDVTDNCVPDEQGSGVVPRPR